MSSESSWFQEVKADKESALRREAFTDLKHAKEADPNWEHTDFVEALMLSRQFVPRTGMQASDRAILDIEGQKRAIELYRVLLTRKDARQKQTIRLNYACCLKRVADFSGQQSDYDELKTVISNFPDDRALLEETFSTFGSKKAGQYLWQRMMGDSELFQSVQKIDPKDYTNFWVNTLNAKVLMRNWTDDLSEIRARNPGAKSWKILL